MRMRAECPGSAGTAETASRMPPRSLSFFRAACLLIATPASLAALIAAPVERMAIHGQAALTISEGVPTSIDSGATIWDAGRVLSEVLLDRDVAGLRILELGSGTGVGGLTAAARGAASVTLTDGERAIMPLLHANIAANGVGSAAKARRLRWGNEAETAAAMSASGPFDIIVGSDLLYAPEAFPELVWTLKRLCTAGHTEVLLTYPTRHSEPIFFEQAEECFDYIEWPCEASPGIFMARLSLRDDEAAEP